MEHETDNLLPLDPASAVPERAALAYPLTRSLLVNVLPSLILLFVSMALIAAAIFMAGGSPLRVKPLPPAAPMPDPLKNTQLLLSNTPYLITMLGFVGCIVAGAMAWLGALLAFVTVSPHVRARMKEFICSMASRPRSVLGIFDSFALICLMVGLTLFVGTTVHLAFNLPTLGMRASAMLAVTDAAWLVVLFAAILLAFWKAGRWGEGARAFWPPWNSKGISPARPLWKDILLGIAAFPATLWLIVLVNLLNQWLVPPDHHQIIDILASHPRPVEIAIIFASATLGAPFFEEIVFRGILYNALRGWFRPLTAAVVGAMAFAAVHMIWSQFLGLMVLGLVMTWLYEKTGRLAASMTFHFTNNFASTVMLYFALHSNTTTTP